MADKKDDFRFEIINSLGVLSQGKKGWQKELNRVSWNGAEPKYDVREWDGEHARMGKGVTMTEDELRALHSLIGAEIKSLDSPEDE